VGTKTKETATEEAGMQETGGPETVREVVGAREAGTEEAGTPEPTYVPLVMKDSPPGVRPCSMAAALEVVGEKWALLALREMGYGVHRFAQIVGYTGAPRDVLTDRLRKLEAAGIIERRLYNEHPPRYEYHLTQAGQELFPVMISLLTWGAKWAMDAPIVQFRHTCGQLVALELGCGHCGEPVTRASLTPIRAVATDDQ
jgi:DNA-binding HxlR family transcriptional regulator